MESLTAEDVIAAERDSDPNWFDCDEAYLTIRCWGDDWVLVELDPKDIWSHLHTNPPTERERQKIERYMELDTEPPPIIALWSPSGEWQPPSNGPFVLNGNHRTFVAAAKGLPLRVMMPREAYEGWQAYRARA